MKTVCALCVLVGAGMCLVDIWIGGFSLLHTGLLLMILGHVADPKK